MHLEVRDCRENVKCFSVILGFGILNLFEFYFLAALP